MTHNLFDNAKFGDTFLTTENKQAVFLRFSENAEYKFAILYIEDWGMVQVFRHNGKEVHDDVAYNVVKKQEEPVSEELEYASEKYACRFSSSKYGHDKVKNAFIAGAQLDRQQMMAKAIDVKINRDTLYDLKPFIHEKYLDYKIGDKCKMILIKED